MKKIMLLSFVLLISAQAVFAQECVVIPAPASYTAGNGEFTISSECKIICDEDLFEMAAIFSESVESYLGRELEISKRGKSEGNITLSINKKASENVEGYTFSINNQSVNIEAPTTRGLFYGLQSLKQIIENEDKLSLKLPAQTIVDAPRFEWRGLMLDVSRTFMNVNLVKRYINLCAQYKINTLHFHLIDDQGWRLEIKRYPRLTEIGSKFAAEFNEMGGYYTQEDIKELVRYAALRSVEIVPEIEIPGHELAAIASYPELSCAKKTPKIHVFMDGPDIHETILCAGSDFTYEFIYGVLDEVMDIFPSKYIHIGGDEAPKSEWKKCAACQKMIKDNNLKNEEELQSHMVKTVGRYLSKHNKTLIGWDEIMDGGMLAGDEVLMFWRGWKGKEVEAELEKGFRVISSPTTHCYIDYPYKRIDTKHLYNFEPVVNKKYESNYLGVQANFWSHIDRGEANVDKQLFPRLLGLAEVGWTLPENKNWERFKKNTRKSIKVLKENYVNVYDDECLK